MHILLLAIFSLFLLLACNKTEVPQPNNQAATGVPVVNSENAQSDYATSNNVTSNSLPDGTYCFNKLFNQDVTEVQLTILGNAVTGTMNWIPYQKDSARGTLKGSKNTVGEMDLMYDYMIEGNQQTETKIMKIEDGKLLVKIGQLLDPKNDGNLVYKDVSQANYTEVLEKVDCKNE